MKKPIIYTAALLLFSFTACDNKTNENTTATNEQENVQSEDLHDKHTNQADISREDHIKMVKAEEVPSFSNVDENYKKSFATLTDQYLQLKEALVASNAQQASQAASAMLNSLKAMDGNNLESDQKDFYQSRSESMRDNLQQIVQNKDLIKQRDHFARISKHITEVVSAFGTSKGSLYYQYCPMAFDNKGAYWLSNSKEIRNPFHPEEMLTCGRVAKQL